jgi:hypothetical protein
MDAVIDSRATSASADAPRATGRELVLTGAASTQDPLTPGLGPWATGVDPRASKKMISRRRRESSAFKPSLGASLTQLRTRKLLNGFKTNGLASEEGELGVYVFALGLRRNFESASFQTDDLASEDGELGVHVFARGLRSNFDRLISSTPGPGVLNLVRSDGEVRCASWISVRFARSSAFR